MEPKNLVSEAQFGFRKSKSKNDAVHSLVDFIVKKLDKKQKSLTIFLDMAQAFDTVSLPSLVSKIE